MENDLHEVGICEAAPSGRIERKSEAPSHFHRGVTSPGTAGKFSRAWHADCDVPADDPLDPQSPAQNFLLPEGGTVNPLGAEGGRSMKLFEHRGVAGPGIVALLVASLWIAASAEAQPVRGDLVITGSASPNPGAGGGLVAYQVNVKNDSTVTATGVLVTVRIPQAAPAPVFVKCGLTGGAKGQLCTQAAGVVTTTFPTIKAHTTVKVSMTLQMPGVSGSFPVVATAHADDAIGGEEPRDGTGSITGAVLSNSVAVTFQPTQRTGLLHCGDVIRPQFFQAGEHTVQLTASLGCAFSTDAVTLAASGVTFDFHGYKIVGASSNQIKGSVGLRVAAGATGVTILGGGTGSKYGLEYFDYCLKDEGGNQGLTVRDLRCFRARSAAIDIVSDDVLLDGVLVDLVVGGTASTTEIPGGIGMHLSGRVSVQDCIVRRAASIGILADGAAGPDGTAHGVTIDGNFDTSRVEKSTGGVGIQLEGAFHTVKNTAVEGDGDDGDSTTGVLVNATGVSIDGLEVAEFGGNGFLVNGDQVTIKRSSVEAVGLDSFVVNGAGALLSGNSVSKGQKAFVVTGVDAFLDTNRAENVLGTAYLVTGDRARMTGNSAKAGKAEGFVLSGNGGNYNTNKAETNVGIAFAISGKRRRLLEQHGQEREDGRRLPGDGNEQPVHDEHRREEQGVGVGHRTQQSR